MAEIHSRATKAAEPPRCAEEKANFPLHHGYARELDLAALLEECLANGQFASPVNQEVTDMRSLGVTATSTFFKNRWAS